jgi:transposase
MKQEVVTVGLDLAKSFFQVHAIGRDGAVLVRRKLLRAEVIGFFADIFLCNENSVFC